ncbi:hypothetical protein FRC11_014223, partial [Ceratobasidium sp. 423]
INSAAGLLNSVTSELRLAETYKDRLTQAQILVRQARNNPVNVRINSLPPEVLTHIFRLVLSPQPCPLRVIDHWNRHNPVIFPKYPDILSQVCSRWRQIAFASHGLWSHIDIALSCPLSRGFHERAQAYVARAHGAPLDIHFIDPGLIRQAGGFTMDDDYNQSAIIDDWSDLMYNNNPKGFDFLTCSTMPCIKSLGLLVRYIYHPIHSRAMEHCFANCLLGGLTELTIDVPWMSSTPVFFETGSESPPSTEHFLSEQQLERAWRSVTTLYLKGRYPRWTSTAYHGLTDLHLFGRMYISGSELVDVLKASPGLRILRCDFEISDLPSFGASTTPIVLQELETLDLRQMIETKVGHFLPWLNPGSKPLQLSFRGRATSALLKDFFARSNVQELRVEESLVPEVPESPSTMFYLPPQLRVLVVSHLGWDAMYGGTRMHTSPRLHSEVSLPLELDTLYMLSCYYADLRNLQEIVKTYSPRRLILWDCKFIRPDVMFPIPILKSEIGNDLFQYCPYIECLAGWDPHPIQDWE